MKSSVVNNTGDSEKSENSSFLLVKLGKAGPNKEKEIKEVSEDGEEDKEETEEDEEYASQEFRTAMVDIDQMPSTYRTYAADDFQPLIYRTLGGYPVVLADAGYRTSKEQTMLQNPTHI